MRGCGRDKSATVADRDVRRADRWPQHRRWPEARTRLHQHSCVRLYGAGACQRGVDTAIAEERGIDLRTEVNDMQNWLSGRTYAETAAWAKVLIDRQTNRIVGAHILGHAAEELIHIFALAMKNGISATDIKD